MSERLDPPGFDAWWKERGRKQATQAAYSRDVAGAAWRAALAWAIRPAVETLTDEERRRLDELDEGAKGA